MTECFGSYFVINGGADEGNLDLFWKLAKWTAGRGGEHGLEELFTARCAATLMALIDGDMAQAHIDWVLELLDDSSCRLTWFDRPRKELGSIGPPGHYHQREPFA